jgi:hypothetical protein
MTRIQRACPQAYQDLARLRLPQILFQQMKICRTSRCPQSHDFRRHRFSTGISSSLGHAMADTLASGGSRRGVTSLALFCSGDSPERQASARTFAACA